MSISTMKDKLKKTAQNTANKAKTVQKQTQAAKAGAKANTKSTDTRRNGKPAAQTAAKKVAQKTGKAVKTGSTTPARRVGKQAVRHAGQAVKKNPKANQALQNVQKSKYSSRKKVAAGIQYRNAGLPDPNMVNDLSKFPKNKGLNAVAPADQAYRSLYVSRYPDATEMGIRERLNLMAPLDLATADSRTGKGNWHSDTGYKKPKKSDKDKALEIVENSKQYFRNKKVSKQKLSDADLENLPDAQGRQVQDAKLRWLEATAKGDNAAAAKAHQEAELLRGVHGYSGGEAGDQYITPDVPREVRNRLNDKGILEWKKAAMKRQKAVTEDEIAKAEQELDKILNRKDYQSRTLETDANGRPIQRDADPERMKRGYDILDAIAYGTGGAYASIPETFYDWDTENLTKAYSDMEDRLAEINNRIQTLQNMPYSEARQKEIDRWIAAQGRLLDGYLKVQDTLAKREEKKPDVTLGQKWLQKAAEAQEGAKEGLDTTGQYLVGGLVTTGQQIPGLLATALSGGAAAPGLITMGLQAAGNKMGELKEQGVPAQERIIRGTGAFASEAGTELIPFTRFIKMAKGGYAGAFVKNFLLNNGFEITSEEASEVVNYLMDKAAKDPNASLTKQDLIDTAILTAISSGTMNLSGAVVGNAGNPTARKRTAAMDLTTPTMDQILEQEQAVQAEMDAWEQRNAQLLEQAQANSNDPTSHKGFLQELEQHQAQKDSLTARMAGIMMQKTQRALIDAQKAQEAQSEAGQGQTTQEPAQNPPQEPQNPLLDVLRPRADIRLPAARTQAPTPLTPLNEAVRNEPAQAEKPKAGLDWNDEYVRQIPVKTAQEVDAVAKALGLHVRFADLNTNVDPNDPNAVYDNGYLEDGVVTISRDIVDPIAVIVGHEFTHRMQELAPEEYQSLKDYVMSRDRYQGIVQKKIEQYRAGGQELDTDKAWDEITADFAGEIINNEQLLSDFVRDVSHNPTLLQRVREFFAELLDKLTGRNRIQVQKAVRMIDAALDQSAETIRSGEAFEQNPNRREMFAGDRARTADPFRLALARDMEEAGDNAETIRRQTGRFRGADGKWRFEISDENARFDFRGNAEVGYTPNYSPADLFEPHSLSEFLTHDELYKAYPELQDVDFRIDSMNDNTDAYYDPSKNEIVMNEKLFASRDEGAVLDTLMHEVQHAVQRTEGFASGASPEYWQNRINRGDNPLTKAQSERLSENNDKIIETAVENPEFFQEVSDLVNMEPEDGWVYDTKTDEFRPTPEQEAFQDRYRELEEKYGEDVLFELYSTMTDSKMLREPNYDLSPYEAYRKTAGEEEARNTTARRTMDEEARRMTPPETGGRDVYFTEGNSYFASYEIRQDENGTPFVVVQDDILKGVPRKDWVSVTKDNLSNKFPDGVKLGGDIVKLNAKARAELTNSRYSKQLKRNDRAIYKDKLRATSGADELLQAAQGYKTEPLYKPRNDGLHDFTKGDVLMRIGNNDYSARVVIATQKGGGKILYDITKITPTTIKEGTGVAQTSKSDVISGATADSANTVAQATQDINRQSAERRHSIRSSFNSIGLTANLEDGRVVVRDKDGKRVKRVTQKMVKQSGMGAIIDYATKDNAHRGAVISQKDANKQVKGVTKLLNMMLKAQDGELVWRFAGSAMFSAVKSNSDGQYGTTVDFSTVCRKTQEMMDAMSYVMKKRKKGLTKDEIIQLQADILTEHGTVPCPVCYVFSRWAGLGGILDNMNNFQEQYRSKEWDKIDPFDSQGRTKLQLRIEELEKASESKEKLQALLSKYDTEYQEFTREVEEYNQENEELEKKKKKLKEEKPPAYKDSIAEIEQKIATNKAMLKNAEAEIKKLEKDGTPELAWLKRVRNDPNYWNEGLIPTDVLFNMNDAATFAEKYPLAWGYRTSRGPSAGKAVLPYSDMRQGDLIMGPGSTSAEGKNPFVTRVEENGDINFVSQVTNGEFSEKQLKAIDSALSRTLAQNLIGGQRFQSTSDFRYDYGLDYLQTFLEAQALGSKMQAYTKIVEFAEMAAGIGGDINISVMPLNSGVDENGHLLYSNVTGADFEAAKRVTRMYDNAQMILVGINDKHILAALDDKGDGKDIGFVIPYHASGASINRFIRGLVENLKETFNEAYYKDYTPVQGDSAKKIKGVEAEQVNEWKEALKENPTNPQFKGKQPTAEQRAMLERMLRNDIRSAILKHRVGSSEQEADELLEKTRDFIHAYSKDISGMSFKELRAIEKRALEGDPEALREYESWSSGVLWDLYQKMWVDETATDTYGVTLNTNQAKSIMPHEYWNTEVDRKHAYINGFIFRSYCHNLGLTPRFTGINSKGANIGYGDFSESTGYWKTLIDRPMYDNKGKYRDQQKVNVTSLTPNKLTKEYNQKRWEGYNTVEEPSDQKAQAAAERFLAREEQPARRFSKRMRQDYETASRNDDRETGQRLADEAAQQAGYTVEAFHGTQQFGFTVPDVRKSDDKISFFVTGDPRIARTYSSVDGVREIRQGEYTPEEREQRIEDTRAEAEQGAARLADAVNSAVSDSAGEALLDSQIIHEDLEEIIRDFSEDYDDAISQTNDYLEELLDRMYRARFNGETDTGWMDADDWLYESGDPVAQQIQPVYDATIQLYSSMARAVHNDETEGNYRVYINPDNLLEVEGNGNQWHRIWFGPLGARSTTREIAEWALGSGYSGVHFTDIVDDGGRGGIRLTEPGDVYALFDPARQTKSADPFTYDDDGNLIPLEERFDPNQDDWRYSKRGAEGNREMFESIYGSRARRRGERNGQPSRQGVPPRVPPRARRDLPRRTEQAGQDPYSVGAAPSGFDAVSSWQNESDTFHPINPRAETAEAENWGRAPVEIPVEDPFGKLTSKTASTFINAGMTPNQVSDELANLAASGRLSRVPYTDRDAVAKAEKTVRDKGYQRAKEMWKEDMERGRMGKDVTTMGITLYNAAANSGHVTEAIEIATDMIGYAKTVAQSLQAVNIINKLGPTGKLYSLTRSIEKLEDQIRKNKNLDPDHWDGITIPPDLAKEYMEAASPEEQRAIEVRIKKAIAQQIPNTLKDKLDAWRYMAMLGNPRTQIRNLAGNLGFQPVRIAKNMIGAGLERIAGIDPAERTKSVQAKAFSQEDRARYEAGLEDYDNVEQIIMGNGKFNDEFSDIDQYRTIFKFKPFEGWRKLTNAGLEKGDVFFAKRTYADSLAGILKARGITADQFRSPDFNQQQKEAIQAIAIEEAQKATYRDLNQFSNYISGLGKKRGTTTEKAVHYLTEGLLPFKKTPANILVRGLEYSPVGLIKGIRDMGTKVKSGDMTAAQGIDEIASGLTGTGLFALGITLALTGLVSPGDDEDEKQSKFNDLLGRQSYALNLPGGYSYTLDWMAPESIPFFMGVELQNARNQIEEGTAGSDLLWNAVRRIADPVLEQSMLSGVNDLLENVSYADNKAASILSTLATGYLSQFVPTIGGQIERTLEDRRYSTWIDRDSKVPSEVQYLIGKNLSKIPGIDYHQREYLNAWGEPEMTGNPLTRALTNFLSPGYVKKESGGAVEAELQRLYDAGFTDVFPTIEKTSTKINDLPVTMEQFNLLQGTKGRTMKDLYTEAISSAAYQNLEDADKADLLGKLADYAKTKGKQAAGDTKEAPKWMQKMEQASEEYGVGVGALLQASMVLDTKYDADGNGYTKTEEAWDGIQDMAKNNGLSEKEQKALFAMYNGTQKTYEEYKAEADKKAEVQANIDKYISTLPQEMQTSLMDACGGNLNSFTQAEAYDAILNMGGTYEQQKAAFDGIQAARGDNAWKEKGVPRTFDSFMKKAGKDAANKKETDAVWGDAPQEHIDALRSAVTANEQSYHGFFKACEEAGIPRSEWPSAYKDTNIRRGSKAFNKSFEQAYTHVYGQKWTG